ncbi:ATP-dependent nuclease [Brevundimonas diminuta]|uniref:Cobalt transporter ATP-binding subunit n=1 Tax=Brevundimonas diminuta TaxID=293 RepID=A0A2X1BXG2_BREDI|nr:ATP-binding protein [Brevundimonas diminuta]SPU46431.1 cobalt transporter ATP-binding subunit [Brevundimonas diminuta]
MALPALQKVKIRRFKRIDEAMVRLGEVNLFVGPNNSGKTSFIQGVHFAISLLQTITYHRKWAVASRSAAVSFGPSELIYVPTESIYSVSHGSALTQDNAISFHFDMDDEEDFSVSVYKGKNKNISIKLHHPWAAKAAADIHAPYSVFCPGLAGIPKNETLVSEGVLRRAVARGDANVVLRNVLYRLSKTTEWKKFQDAFSTIFPNFEIRVQFEESLAEYIEAYVSNSGQEIPLELAGTGMLQMAQILAYVFYFSPRLLILDEPDSHLHPNNQRSMCRMIMKLGSERGMQIIMASHSRHVLGSGLIAKRAL